MISLLPKLTLLKTIILFYFKALVSGFSWKVGDKWKSSDIGDICDPKGGNFRSLWKLLPNQDKV